MQPEKITYGLFINNIAKWMTEEQLWFHLKNHVSADKLQQIKIPRDRETQEVKGYAFVQLASLDEARQIRKDINYIDIMGNQLQVALIGPKNDQKKESEQNVLVRNIEHEVTPKQFDEFCSRWGSVMSSRLASTANGDKTTLGYVQFERPEDASRFIQESNNGSTKIKENVVSAIKWSVYSTSAEHNQNIFFKDYKVKFDQDVIDDEVKCREQIEKIEAEIKSYFSEFSILSLIVKINPKFLAPFCFVCFETHDDAEKAKIKSEADDKFPFQFRVWCKTQSELQQEREDKRDDRYIFIKNLKREVTEEKLRETIEQYKSLDGKKIEILSVKIFKPADPKYETNYATIVLKDNNQMDNLKKWAGIADSEFNKLFKDKGKPFVSLLHHKRFHKKYIQTKFYGNMDNNNRPGNGSIYQTGRPGSHQPGFGNRQPGPFGFPATFTQAPFGLLPQTTGGLRNSQFGGAPGLAPQFNLGGAPGLGGPQLGLAQSPFGFGFPTQFQAPLGLGNSIVQPILHHNNQGFQPRGGQQFGGFQPRPFQHNNNYHHHNNNNNQFQQRNFQYQQNRGHQNFRDHNNNFRGGQPFQGQPRQISQGGNVPQQTNQQQQQQ